MLEQERRWEYIQEGRGHEYHGIAVHPRHLSLFEKGILGLHRQYNPQLDAEAKKREAEQKISQRIQVGFCCAVAVISSSAAEHLVRRRALSVHGEHYISSGTRRVRWLLNSLKCLSKCCSKWSVGPAFAGAEFEYYTNA